MLTPPNPPVPLPGEVHIWFVRLLHGESRQSIGVLSDDERERAERFRLPEDRLRFGVTRACLRLLLGRYLDEPARALTFEYGPFGRPSLPMRPGTPRLGFSVTHSGNYALLAFGRDLMLGVDIEDLAVNRDIDRIAAAILSPAAYLAWRGAEPAVRKMMLLQIWTRREAVAKALGRGLSLTPAEHERALAGRDALVVRDIRPADDCVAAIASRTSSLKVDIAAFDPAIFSTACIH